MGVQRDGKNRRVKNKGGAPKGNRNALKHGAYTKEKLLARRALRDEMRTLMLQMTATVARANLMMMGRKPIVNVKRIYRTLDD